MSDTFQFETIFLIVIHIEKKIIGIVISDIPTIILQVPNSVEPNQMQP